jgi:hypothetical protein
MRIAEYLRDSAVTGIAELTAPNRSLRDTVGEQLCARLTTRHDLLWTSLFTEGR